ncbi:hypothetical protein DFH06DRAFT_1323834 [Mycena polygramma]|nr:hypothetical protein DFH06DRAFT_1323834 [Mycena polygramma]
MFFVHLRLLSRATTGYARSLQALAVTGGAATGSLRARNAILSPESKAPNTQAFHSSSRSSDKKRPIDPLVQYWDPPSTYPSGWIDGHHNEDYAIVGSPLEPQHIMHFYESEGQMYFRISFKIQEGMYLPMTFLVQTGAAHSMYLCLE